MAQWMKNAAMTVTVHMPIAPHFLMEIQVYLAAAAWDGIII
jgi:hypothetical protein